VDAQALLMGSADQVYAAERLFGQPAEILAPVLIDQQDAPAAAEQLVRGYDAG